MATFRVGIGSFNIKDGAVGFGTEIDGLGNLRVKGVTKTTGSIVSGASTLTRYSGFAADNINQLEKEHFGPVLHLVRFKASDLSNVIDEINSTGFGLTLGIHSRNESLADAPAVGARLVHFFGFRF